MEQMEQITIDQWLKAEKTKKSFNRDGTMRPTPEWANEERCENCKNWVLLPITEQPAEGWGVKGLCCSHRSQGRCKTDGFSWCQDHEWRE